MTVLIILLLVLRKDRITNTVEINAHPQLRTMFDYKKQVHLIEFTVVHHPAWE